jgi:enamine deaminase RidA (YjgF/YER057c/UK114 family)
MVEKQLINPPQLPRPSGFTHGIATSGGRLLFLSGQTGSDAHGNIVMGGLLAQYEQMLRNLQVVVEAAGGGMQNIVQTTIFVRNREDYLSHLKALGELHRTYFGQYYPAAALFEVSGFFQEEALVEISGIAVI